MSSYGNDDLVCDGTEKISVPLRRFYFQPSSFIPESSRIVPVSPLESSIPGARRRTTFRRLRMCPAPLGDAVVFFRTTLTGDPFPHEPQLLLDQLVRLFLKAPGRRFSESEDGKGSGSGDVYLPQNQGDENSAVFKGDFQASGYMCSDGLETENILYLLK
ncbi:hypothetical protein EYF80_030363 [Liparis tanakae]|uniref:Uncharacterized protein n=1 Tax=Liparis tanakae TaxID=230148 RepID=A0A4Z2H0T0_9TELE|nr:hypothetical protein EYF80_030363 [Liparis tanakae]